MSFTWQIVINYGQIGRSLGFIRIEKNLVFGRSGTFAFGHSDLDHWLGRYFNIIGTTVINLSCLMRVHNFKLGKMMSSYEKELSIRFTVPWIISICIFFPF